MGKVVDATLVGITCEFTADGGPVGISGTLVANDFTRQRTATVSKVLFTSDTPVTIAVGDTLAIGKKVAISLSREHVEQTSLSENLGLGGKLSIGGPRHLIIPTFEIHRFTHTSTGEPDDPPLRLNLRFASDDGTQQVRVDFEVIVTGIF